MFVALVNGRVVGNAGVHLVSDNPGCVTFAASVLPSVHGIRGLGIGRALMNYTLDFAERWANYSRIELTVHADNARAVQLYESLLASFMRDVIAIFLPRRWLRRCVVHGAFDGGAAGCRQAWRYGLTSADTTRRCCPAPASAGSSPWCSRRGISTQRPSHEVDGRAVWCARAGSRARIVTVASGIRLRPHRPGDIGWVIACTVNCTGGIVTAGMARLGWSL